MHEDACDGSSHHDPADDSHGKSHWKGGSLDRDKQADASHQPQDRPQAELKPAGDGVVSFRRARAPRSHRKKRPPLRSITPPVMKLEASLAKYSTAWATSSARELRPSGVWRRYSSIFSGEVNASWCGVSTTPGMMQLARTSGASSRASVRVKTCSAPLAAA